VGENYSLFVGVATDTSDNFNRFGESGPLFGLVFSYLQIISWSSNALTSGSEHFGHHQDGMPKRMGNRFFHDEWGFLGHFVRGKAFGDLKRMGIGIKVM
jgi:hypothetical protein